MAIAEILLTDTFSEWMQKDNLMIGFVNSLSATGDLLSVSDASPGDILMWTGDFFENVTVHGDVVFADDGTATVTGGGTENSKGRMYFAGNIRGIF